MGSKNQNQKTEEKKEENTPTQAAENQQTETPAQAGSEQPTGTTETPPAPVVPELPPTAEGNDKTDGTSKTEPAEKTVKLVLKHKSHTPHYHRCGLTLTKTFAEYEVPESAVEKLKADKWIVVQESK